MNLVKNEKIKALLFNRWKELGLRVADVIQDANERGQKIHASSMSKYRSSAKKETISQEQLLWLCTRWGVFVSFNIGEPLITGKDGKEITGAKAKYEVKPYSEKRCLALLEKIYGKK